MHLKTYSATEFKVHHVTNRGYTFLIHIKTGTIVLVPKGESAKFFEGGDNQFIVVTELWNSRRGGEHNEVKTLRWQPKGIEL